MALSSKGRSHTPYRQSKLTHLLKDSLGGNCKTVMVATMHPGAQHTDESISTCKFAQRVAMGKNEVSRNEAVDHAALMLADARNTATTDTSSSGDDEARVARDAPRIDDTGRPPPRRDDDGRGARHHADRGRSRRGRAAGRDLEQAAAVRRKRTESTLGN